jgi:hypothetical protein
MSPLGMHLHRPRIFLFATFNWWLLLFVAVTAIVLWYLPGMTRFVIRSVGHRVSEPEVKFVFFVLFLLGG